MKRRSIARFCYVLLCLFIASFPVFVCSCGQEEQAGAAIDCHVYIICAYKSNLVSGYSAEMDAFIKDVFWTMSADLRNSRIFYHGSDIKAGKIDAYPIYWDEPFLNKGVNDGICDGINYYSDDTWPKTYEPFLRWTKSKCEAMHNFSCPSIFILKAEHFSEVEQTHGLTYPGLPAVFGDAAGWERAICIDAPCQDWSFTSTNPFGVIYASTAADYVNDVNKKIASWPYPYNTTRIQPADFVSYLVSHELSHEVGIYPLDTTSWDEPDKFGHDGDTLCVMNKNGYGSAALDKALVSDYAWAVHIINKYPSVKHICTNCAKSRMNRTIHQFYLSRCPNAMQGH